MSNAKTDLALFLVRLGVEVTTKSRRTRRHFQSRLIDNLRDAVESSGFEMRVENLWSRILIETSSPEALSAMARVHGVSSISPIDARIPADLTRIVEVGEELYAIRVEGKTFAVAARRTGKQSFRSQAVREELGAALLPHSAGVDLDNPEFTASVEVRDSQAFLFSERIPGPGGLPLGVEGKAVCLLSGGFDSAVAAWLLLKRGVSLEYVFCNLGGAAYERSVLAVAKVLADRWSYGDRPRIHIVEFAEPIEALRERVGGAYWQVVLKRLMYRAAGRIAAEVQADGVVTGESLGQVSSQTLGNLRAIDDAVDLPVFRPLLGLEKPEIIERANEIGTGPISAKVREYCAINTGRPVTNARPGLVRREEDKLDLALLDRVVGERNVLDLRSMDPVDLVAPYLFMEKIPETAAVLDIRGKKEYAAWHFPGAIRKDPSELRRRRLRELDKEQVYVLYCRYGLESADVVEEMQRQGFEAYAYRGGVEKLRREAEPA